MSRQVREIFKRHTDLIEPLSLDEAYLDVTENKTGLPTATRVAQTIREQIRTELNLTASAGVAPNKFLAKIASDWRKPDGLFVIQPTDWIFLAAAAGRADSRRGKVTEARLEKLGVTHVGDLLRIRTGRTLKRHFGRYGSRLYELARGIDENPVVPDRPKQSRYPPKIRSTARRAPVCNGASDSPNSPRSYGALRAKECAWRGRWC